MTEIKDTKLTANITENDSVEYVTFWGKLKGNIEKQTDLMNLLGLIRRSVSELSTKYLRKQDKLTPGKNITIEENSEGDLVIDGPTHTSQLVNDGNGDTSSEGLFIPYVTLPEVGDALVPVNDRIDTVETNIADIESLLDSKQDNLTAGEGINLEDNIISVKHGTTPNDGILTIKQNDKSIGTFSANQSENKDINIKVNSLPDMEAGFDGKVLSVENQVWRMIDLPSEVLLATMTITGGEPILDIDFSDISKAISAGKVVIVKVDTTGEYMYLSKNRSYTEDNVNKLEFTFSNLEFNSNSDSLIADYIVLIIGYNNSTNSTYSSFTRIPLTIEKR